MIKKVILFFCVFLLSISISVGLSEEAIEFNLPDDLQIESIRVITYHDANPMSDATDDSIATYVALYALSYLEPNMTFPEYVNKLNDLDVEYEMRITHVREAGTAKDTIILQFSRYLSVYLYGEPYEYDESDVVEFIKGGEVVFKWSDAQEIPQGHIEEAYLSAIGPFETEEYDEIVQEIVGIRYQFSAWIKIELHERKGINLDFEGSTITFTTFLVPSE